MSLSGDELRSLLGPNLIAGVHAVHMRANDSEVLEALRRGGVGRVNDDSQVVADGADAALE